MQTHGAEARTREPARVDDAAVETGTSPPADRNPKTEKMPGHILLARLGKRVLRPGGVELTDSMLDNLAIGADDDVVELASGVGATAVRTLEREPHSYLGVEADAERAQVTAAELSGHSTCPVAMRVADAKDTGLPVASASVVYGEAMLTMLSADHKRAVVRESVRVLRAGGRYGIHELCLHPDDLSDDIKTEIRKELTRSIRVGARPLTIPEWCGLLEEAGLRVDVVETAPMHLLEPRRLIADEGVGGLARILRNVARDRTARRRVLSMRRTFRRYADHIGAIAIVASKPTQHSSAQTEG